MRLRTCLSLIAHASLSSSKIIPPNERCFTAVYTAYNYIAFTTAPSNDFYETQCEDSLKVTSTYASSEVLCQPDERSAGISQLETLCMEFGFHLIPRQQLAENLTTDAISRMRAVHYLEVPETEPFDVPVLITRPHYDRVFRTIDTWAYESWMHYAYGYAGYLYWACILGVGMLYRLAQQLLYFRHDHLSPPSSRQPLQQIHHQVQTHFVVSTTIPSHGREFFCWTFSNRGEAIVTLGFWVLSTVACILSYRIFPENIYWPEPSTQLIRYAADRTGILSFANLPVLWLFAGRNNICAWATGWNFATFNIFHRHVAWIATIQAAVHTVLYLVLFFRENDVWSELTQPYLLWGTLATVVMVLILPPAVNWFRHRAYETFLVIHIAFSIILIVGCFYHTLIFPGHEYWFYLWLPLAIWAFDRILRLVRMVHCNVHVRMSPQSQLQCTSSIAIYDKAADLIRLEVVPGSPSLRPRPGQYYFLSQPFRLTGWESHPFTLGSWSYEIGRGGSSSPPAFATKDTEQLDVTQIPLLSDDSSSSSRTRSRTTETQSSYPTPRDLKLIFWIRPYNGWTRHLRRKCLHSPDRTSDVTILLEGPYGHESPLRSFDSVLLIAGGTGIASAVPYINDHIARSSSGTRGDGDGDEDEDGYHAKTRTQDLQLIWVTRQPAFISQLASRELSATLGRDDFRASFYSTSPPGPWQRQQQRGAHVPDLEFPTTTTTGNPDKEVDIIEGRPNLAKRIVAFAHEARASDSSAAVLVCGPRALADEARGAVYGALRQGYSIHYVEESFSW
ncbi:ferric reductase family protein [Aspergillus lucknowensis]|uniref:Ferric reductase like transmembrane component-domain-containing protein n=1 Tax=Aspergillus lucknowensis TaxID=176173 RepID=A0ABR4LFQ7_9EURO